MKRTKLLCVFLAVMLLLALTACGKDKTADSDLHETEDSNLLEIGEYELHYKGASIMEDSDGNDALILTLDFTNNSKDASSYVWSISETVMQNGTELAALSLWTATPTTR